MFRFDYEPGTIRYGEECVAALGEELDALGDRDGGYPESLLDPYDGDDLRIYPISWAVNIPGNDTEDILEPRTIGKQASLDGF